MLPLIQTSASPYLLPVPYPGPPNHAPPLYPPLDLLVTGFVVGSAIADGVGHRAGRAGRRGRGGRAFSGRRGRQEEAALGGYAEPPPLDNYGAASDELSARDLELQALSANIPGVPGEDYPILAEVPESGFTCDGQVGDGKEICIQFIKQSNYESSLFCCNKWTFENLFFK